MNSENEYFSAQSARMTESAVRETSSYEATEIHFRERIFNYVILLGLGLDKILLWCLSLPRDIFDAMFMVKHEADEIIIQQGMYGFCTTNPGT